MSVSGHSSRSSAWKRALARLRPNPQTTTAAAQSAEPGFFDEYPRFYSTSKTGTQPERLNPRYRALIETNRELIRDQSVLDLASHDGRWSFAAVKAGARHVTGIEGRAYLVASANSTFLDYGVSQERFRFIVGDVFDGLDLLEPDSIQTVFCFGFFYHTPHHMLLLSKIARLNPRHLVLDTEIDPSTSESVVRLKMERVSREANSPIEAPGDPTQAVVGAPSRSALELMLSSFGWNFRYYDWHHAGITDWRALYDYHGGRRVTLMASRE
jgi:hypothetical protein